MAFLERNATKWASTVQRRPWAVIWTCVFAVGISSLGLLRARIKTDPDKIWVPPGSATSREKAFSDSSFGPFFRINQLIFKAKDGSNVVSKKFLQRVMQVQHRIQRGTTTLANGTAVSLDALCFRPIAGKGCLVESPSQLWRDDPVLLNKDPSPALTAACQTTEPTLAAHAPCMDAIGTPVMRNVIFGGLSEDPSIRNPDPCGAGVPAAKALIVTFLLENRLDKEFQETALAWEKDVFLREAEAEAHRLGADAQEAPMHVSYLAQRSTEDSLTLQARDNAWVVVASYAAMFVYVALALGRPGHARTRLGLAATGICVVAASMAATVGLLSGFGLGTTLIVWEVVPFLLLAIGVDNVFILVREFDRLEASPRFNPKASSCVTKTALGPAMAAVASNATPDDSLAGAAEGPESSRCEALHSSFEMGSMLAKDRSAAADDSKLVLLERRLATAVAHVAPSVLGAAACEALAFAVGALTGVPALRQFCIVAAVAVAVNLVLQASWFVAALALDARRVTAGRPELPWCCRRCRGGASSFPQSTADTTTDLPNSSSSALRLLPWRRSSQRRSSVDSDGSGSTGGSGSVCSEGPQELQSPQQQPRPQQQRPGGDGAAGDWAGRAMERFYLPKLFSPAGRIVVGVTAVALLGLGIAGVIMLPMGLEPQLAAPADSYLQAYYTDLFSLGEAGPPAYAVLRNVDYFAALNLSSPSLGGGQRRSTDKSSDNDRFGDGSSLAAVGGSAGGLRVLSAGLAGLTRFVLPPVYSWFDAFASWLSRADMLGADCPPPPEVTDAASLAAAARVFVGIPIDSECCQSFGVCGAQFATDVAFSSPPSLNESSAAAGDGGGADNGYRIAASRLRFNTQPLRHQRDFVSSAQALRRAVEALAHQLPRAAGEAGGGGHVKGVGVAFAYSLYFAFYEQYDYIRGVAMQDVALALGAVFFAVYCLAGASIAASVALLVLLTVLDMIGMVWLWGIISNGPFGVSVNAVSVVNAVAGVGLAVEFCLHVAVAFRRAGGYSNKARAIAAMRARGASVFTGITLTKLVGVSVLAVAPSKLFRLYYFRMYISLVAAGAFNGLAVLPLLLAFCGPEPEAAVAVGPRSSSSSGSFNSAGSSSGIASSRGGRSTRHRRVKSARRAAAAVAAATADVTAALGGGEDDLTRPLLECGAGSGGGGGGGGCGSGPAKEVELDVDFDEVMSG